MTILCILYLYVVATVLTLATLGDLTQNRTNPIWVASPMDKLELTGQNLGRVFKSRLSRVCIGHELYTFCKTAKLKVENLAQTTFRFYRKRYNL